MTPKKVFVSGCYDLLHSGHVEFFRQAAQYGDLYVGIGSDETILHYKKHRTVYPERERLFMVKAIRYVKDAFINSGDGVMDFVPTVEQLKPDIFVVNEDGASDEKEALCRRMGIEYIVLPRTPSEGLTARSSTDLKKQTCSIPTRLDLAGTWIDQPYVSRYGAGWAITISLEPTFEIQDRCGLSTSTRNRIRSIWPYKLPDMDPEMLARLVFCFENDPERSDGIRFESCHDEEVLSWLEERLCLVPMFPRRDGCSVVEGAQIDAQHVRALTTAADECWGAILNRNLEHFASAYKASFEAQVAMFPAMIQPGVQEYIDKYSVMDGVLAWKMPGAGGGGYLALVCRDEACIPEEAIRLTIRRRHSGDHF